MNKEEAIKTLRSLYEKALIETNNYFLNQIKKEMEMMKGTSEKAVTPPLDKESLSRAFSVCSLGFTQIDVTKGTKKKEKEVMR